MSVAQRQQTSTATCQARAADRAARYPAVGMAVPLGSGGRGATGVKEVAVEAERAVDQGDLRRLRRNSMRKWMIISEAEQRRLEKQMLLLPPR